MPQCVRAGAGNPRPDRQWASPVPASEPQVLGQSRVLHLKTSELRLLRQAGLANSLELLVRRGSSTVLGHTWLCAGPQPHEAAAFLHGDAGAGQAGPEHTCLRSQGCGAHVSAGTPAALRLFLRKGSALPGVACGRRFHC